VGCRARDGAIIEANHGKVAFTRMESDSTLGGVAAKVDFGPDYQHLYGGAGPNLYVNGNVSPHFPYAAELTQATSYAKFAGTSRAENEQRKAYLLEVATAASKKILDTRAEPIKLLREAGTAAGERRVMVWSSDPVLQADLAQTSVAGVIPTTTASYVGLSIVNAGGSKLDCYLDCYSTVA
jgi:hypothetical protein